MVVDNGPRQVTRGQETVSRREEGKDLPIKFEGVQLSVDYASITFTPPSGELESGEENPADVDRHKETWRLEAMYRERNPAEQGAKDAVRFQALMVERERCLRSLVQVAVSVALGCSLDDWFPLEYGSQGYHGAIQGPEGARISYDPKGRFDFNLLLPGKACRRMGAEPMKKLLRICLTNGGKARRLDAAIDDYSRTVSPVQVLAEAQGSDVVSKVKKGIRIHGFEIGHAQVTGDTVYFGSPTSRRRMRVYDKGLESNGETDCIRWEMQERDQAAESLILALAYREWQTVIPERLVSLVDFRESDSHSEVEKRDRCEWFKVFVGAVERANVYLAQSIGTIEEKIDWLRQNIAPTLAVCMAAWKGDLGELEDIIADGKRRWKPRHKLLVAQC